MKRLFLDWKQPFLPALADHLLGRTQKTQLQCVDLTRFLIVLPGSRAMRRLNELLVIGADQKGKILLPPRMLTVGALPEEVLNVTSPAAREFERLFSWCEALKSLSLDKQKALIPEPYAANDIRSWIGLSQHVDAIYTELSGAMLSFKDVHLHISKNSSDRDAIRWEILAEAHSLFAKSLELKKLADKYEKRKRLLSELKFVGDSTLIVAGASDLNQFTKKLLTEYTGEVEIAIFAPTSEEHSFDEWGSVLPDVWKNRELSIPEDDLVYCADIAASASTIGDLVSDILKKRSTGEITIGLGMPATGGIYEEEISRRGIEVRRATGLPFIQSEYYTFLERVAEYLGTFSSDSFLSLVTHPRVEKFISPNIGNLFPSYFDEYLKFQRESAQAFIPLRRKDRLKYPKGVEKLVEALGNLIGPLNSESQALSSWVSATRQVLTSLYSGIVAKDDRDNKLLGDGAEILGQVLDDSSSLSTHEKLRGFEALSLILEMLRTAAIEPDPGRTAIELLGWLELSLDDAPALIISGIQEKSVPDTLNSDSFLPNAVRSALGLLDNDRRYARDLYALCTMQESKEILTCVTARRDSDGTPLHISRLLLACNSKARATRVLKFYGVESGAAPKYSELNTTSNYTVIKPPPKLSSPIESLSVTSLSDYLECPYRFYLKHVLGLDISKSSVSELDAIGFGRLVHDVLHAFGLSDTALSESKDEIQEFFEIELEKRRTEIFGSTAYPAVYMQIEHLKGRLRYFADWQARWRSDGWRIMNVESQFGPNEAALSLSKGKIGLRGRIDRIDYNERNSTWHVWDYKSGERAYEPEKKHFQRGVWVDFQLPAYQMAIEARHKTKAIELGYLNICGESEKIGSAIASWGEDRLKDAQAKMVSIAEDILAEKFWPPAKLSSRDDFPFLSSKIVGDLEDADA